MRHLQLIAGQVLHRVRYCIDSRIVSGQIDRIDNIIAGDLAGHKIFSLQVRCYINSFPSLIILELSVEEVIVRYLHFMGIIVLAATIFAEHLLIKAEMSSVEIRKIAIIDAVFGFAAIVVLIAGLSLWLWIGKPAAFYAGNVLFHIKITAFMVLGLLSLYPTMFFVRHRKTTAASIVIPKVIIHLIRAELALLLVIPLLAVLMARGYGL